MTGLKAAFAADKQAREGSEKLQLKNLGLYVLNHGISSFASYSATALTNLEGTKDTIIAAIDALGSSDENACEKALMVAMKAGAQMFIDVIQNAQQSSKDALEAINDATSKWNEMTGDFAGTGQPPAAIV